MMTRSRIAIAFISLFIGLLVCSSETQALPLVQASATGGPSLGENSGLIQNDYWDPSYWTTGVPYFVEASDPQKPLTGYAPLTDYAEARAAITATGVELSGKSHAPRAANPADTSTTHGYASSFSKAYDYFTLDTISGPSGAVLDAASIFNLTGTIEVFSASTDSGGSVMESGGTISVDLTAKREDGSLLDSITIRWGYWIEDPAYYYKYFADNNTYDALLNPDGWENLYNVDPDFTGSAYNFDVSFGLELEDMEADTPTFLELTLSTGANVAITDFSNTLKTDPINPFVITSNPTGNSYILNSVQQGNTVGLFGALDGGTVGGSGTGNPVPEPATIFLLAAGLVGIAGVTRRKLKK